jgi:hypothetical protein
MIAIAVTGPPSNTNSRQATDHQFHPRFYQQIGFREYLGLFCIAQFLLTIGFDQFQTSAKILIRWNKGSVADDIIGIG